MRFAPTKGDCVLCQAPEPTRLAINAAIWPGEAMIRSATYRATAVDVARASGIPAFAKLNPKTVTRHVDHIESSWREVSPNDEPRPNEVAVKGDFMSLVDQAGRVGAKALANLEQRVDNGWLDAKDVVSIAKLGVTAASAGEAARLKSRQQKIDVMAIFAQSTGHIALPPGDIDETDDVPIEVLKAALSDERRQLAERNE